jgi:hypothetical protein
MYSSESARTRPVPALSVTRIANSTGNPCRRKLLLRRLLASACISGGSSYRPKHTARMPTHLARQSPCRATEHPHAASPEAVLVVFSRETTNNRQQNSTEKRQWPGRSRRPSGPLNHAHALALIHWRSDASTNARASAAYTHLALLSRRSVIRAALPRSERR